jgi:nicotinate-nucleotide adenylyltransferase
VKKLGILSGAFNPVTRAHLALVDAALSKVDEVLCVVPRAYPHKEFHGASLEDRVEMLRHAGENYRVEIVEGGLLIDIARELKRTHPNAEFYFITGRDAAERVVTWDYGDPQAVHQIFEELHLLVASRQGVYQPPNGLRHRIHALDMKESFDEVSSTEVRRRIAAGEPWEVLVPEEIIEIVRRIYLG